MFATLRCGPDRNGESVRLEHRHRPDSVRVAGLQHSACQNCRTRKLRCNGDRAGCQRCRHKGLNCNYPPSSTQRKRKQSNGLHDQADPSLMDFEASGSPHSQDSRQLNTPRDCNGQSDYTWTEDSDTAFSFIDTLSGQTRSANGPDYIQAFDAFSAATDTDQQYLDHNIVTDVTSCSPKSVWENSEFSDDTVNSVNLGSAQTLAVPYEQDEDKEGPAINLTSSASPFLHFPRNSNPAAVQNLPTSTNSQSRSVSKVLSGQQQGSNIQGRLSNIEDQHNLKSDCRCLGRAVAVIEEIEIRRQHANIAKADVVLSLQARALDRCDALLECKECANVSHSMMLLLLLCEKISTSSLLTEEEVESPGLQSGVVQRSFENDSGGGNYLHGPRMIIGEYEVSSSLERTRVIRALQSCFTARLMELLRRFEGLAASKGWQAQLMMVVNLKNRTSKSA